MDDCKHQLAFDECTDIGTVILDKNVVPCMSYCNYAKAMQICYRIKTSMLTEKLEKLSPTDRNKILQMVDIMLGEK